MRQKRWIRLASIAATLWAVTCCVAARTLTVSVDPPAEFRTIQAAIDAAVDGDTVVVAPGTYTGPGNCDLAFNGKAITVRSTNGPGVTIVDGAGTGHGFYIRDNESGPARLEGFTLRRTIRGAVKCYSSSPPRAAALSASAAPGPWDYAPIVISDCIIEDNLDSGILMDGHDKVTVANCIIRRNGTAGLWAFMSFPTIRNCTVVENEGHGISVTGGQIVNCTVAANTRIGLWVDQASVTNSIIRNNDLHEIYNPRGGVSVAYCNVRGGCEGTGNFDVDPCFADPGSGDYSLQSQAGRWDSRDRRWVQDEATSPCIDAGDPRHPVGFEPFPNGGRVNIGAGGGTTCAGKSYFGAPLCETVIAGDINGDCRVDFADLRLLALHWLENALTAAPGPPASPMPQPFVVGDTGLQED
ncbi:MAG: right-handed parallel beta-helix repeat-containing protein [Sedimentisphaerales bacterium]|nr:right-handed parallel beta-helix repeat-containing protein [Sedimentisphaerales bacterium]